MTQMLEWGRISLRHKILQHSTMNSWSSWKSQQRNKIYEENPFGNLNLHKNTIISEFLKTSTLQLNGGDNGKKISEVGETVGITQAEMQWEKQAEKVNRATKSCLCHWNLRNRERERSALKKYLEKLWLNSFQIWKRKTSWNFSKYGKRHTWI